MPSLLIKVGGLSLYPTVKADSHVFVASMAQSWGVTCSYIERQRICGMHFDFDRALDGLSDAIPDFDLNGFTR